MKRRTKKVLGLALTAFVGVGAIIPLASCYGPPMQESYLDTSPKDVMVKNVNIELNLTFTMDSSDKLIISQNVDDYLDLDDISLVSEKNILGSSFVDNKYTISGRYVVDSNKPFALNINLVKSDNSKTLLTAIVTEIEGGYIINLSLVE